LATLGQAKTLGGVGSILIFIPFVSILGWILVLIAIKEISDDLQDKSIFSDVLIAGVTGIIGALAGGVVAVLGVGSIASLGVSIVGGLVVAWIFLIISAIFLRKAYDKMSTRLGVKMFKTAATLYLVGAALAIVAIGFILLFIAEIIQAVSFFQIPEQIPGSASMSGGASPSTSAMGVNQMPGPGEATKFCTSCGTKISPSATFCYACGAKQ
jgi:uncharacterized membrane protein